MYAPDLDPADVAFEGVRRRTGGRPNPSMKDEVAAGAAYLTSLESDTNRVRALVGWDWIGEASRGSLARIAKKTQPE